MKSRQVIGAVAIVLIGALAYYFFFMKNAGGTAGRYQQATLPIGAPEDATPELIGGMELVLEGNGNFRMNGFPPIEGTWSETGGTIQLTPGEGAPSITLTRDGDRLKQTDPEPANGIFWIPIE